MEHKSKVQRDEATSQQNVSVAILGTYGNTTYRDKSSHAGSPNANGRDGQTSRSPVKKDQFLDDQIVQAYIGALRSRSKSTGKDLDGKTTTHISTATMEHMTQALRHVLRYLEIPDSDHAITDIVNDCYDRQLKAALEQRLRVFVNLESITMHRMYGTYFKGVLKRGGGMMLNVACDNHFTGEHSAIDPITLRDLRNELGYEQGIWMDLLAYTGERPTELFNHRLDQFQHMNENYTKLNSIKFQNKGGIEHFTILPRAIAEAAIQIAIQHHWSVILPDHENKLRDIYSLAKTKYGVHLSAKYFRQRYKTIASDTGMPANHYNFLEGSKPKDGANAAFYDLRDEAKFLREYDILLAPFLSPASILTPQAGRNPTLTENLTSASAVEINTKLDAILKHLGIPPHEQTSEKKEDDPRGPTGPEGPAGPTDPAPSDED